MTCWEGSQTLCVLYKWLSENTHQTSLKTGSDNVKIKLYKIERVIWYEKYSYGYLEQNEDGDYILTIPKAGGLYVIKISKSNN